MITPNDREPVETMFDSSDSLLVEVTITPSDPEPMSEAMLLHLMRTRLQYYGSPIPEGYVAPPGIDLGALLKQVPWPPAA